MSDNSTPASDAGEIGLANHWLRGHIITVDGQPAPRDKGFFLIPGDDGEPIRARLKGRWFSEYPTLVVDGQSRRMGPHTPAFLVVAMFLPVLFFLGANWLTALLAVVLIGFNAYVLRSKRTEAMKSFMMLTAFMLTAVLMVILAFLVPWVGGLFRH